MVSLAPGTTNAACSANRPNSEGLAPPLRRHGKCMDSQVMNRAGPCLQNLFSPPPLPGRERGSSPPAPCGARPSSRPPPLPPKRRTTPPAQSAAPEGRSLPPPRSSSRPPPPPRPARANHSAAPRPSLPGTPLLDDALLSAAPPPPVVPLDVDPSASVMAPEPAPHSVAALLDDTLDGTFDPESWDGDVPLSQGEAPTARLGKRPRLPSLAYLEGDEASHPGASAPL